MGGVDPRRPEWRGAIGAAAEPHSPAAQSRPARQELRVFVRIAVLGGGNGSFAAAGDFALAGHQVRMWRRDRGAVADHCAAGRTIELKDFRGQHTASLELVTSDIGAAVDGSELILCPTPAFAQADIAELLAPHLAQGQVVFLRPGTFGSVLLARKGWQSGNHARLA